jgi:hypothetical protein
MEASTRSSSRSSSSSSSGSGNNSGIISSSSCSSDSSNSSSGIISGSSCSSKDSCTHSQQSSGHVVKDTDTLSFRLVSTFEENNPEHRPTMEDEFRVIPKLPIDGERVISYFGVYDGHGGRGTVDFLKEGLEKAVCTAISQGQDDGFDMPEFLRRYDLFFRSAF